jgi:hypothetical protein
MLSQMYLYLEHIVIENYYAFKYSRYVADVAFNNFIDSLINVGGAQTIAAKFNLKEELFNLEKSGRALPICTVSFEPPSFVNCKCAHK